jgi:hypothetical protein
MANKITFTREALDNYKNVRQEAIDKGHDTFVWKGSLNNVHDSGLLIDKLERSKYLSILINSTYG